MSRRAESLAARIEEGAAGLAAYLDRRIPGGLHAKGSLVRLFVVASSR